MAAACSGAAQTTIHVPAGGNLQQAIDQAQPGDTITLAPGATYTGNFRLRKKPGAGFITITTADPGTLPPPGGRITPARAPALPKIKTPNSAAAIATDNGAHHYRLVGLEVHGAPEVYTLEMIALGSGTATQTSDWPPTSNSTGFTFTAIRRLRRPGNGQSNRTGDS